MIILNKDIIKLESVSSTNDFAKDILLKSIPKADITIIDTKEQTKGRGQRGNYWESEKNKNISLSIIIKPTFLKPNLQFYLSMSVSLAIVNCLSEFVENITIKWPNDIYINNKKICGILIENRLLGDSIQYSIIGIGLNINQRNFSDWIPNPTSLILENGIEINIESIKTKLIECFEGQYSKLIAHDFETISREYLKNLYLRNILSLFKDSTGHFEGKIKSVDSSGYIEIEKSNNEIKFYTFKEVEYIKPI
jgi:BirA family transcriptional regulator, biotin operon repressor / biotin---[acetyl-CoA-carboxylase] ligase